MNDWLHESLKRWCHAAKIIAKIVDRFACYKNGFPLFREMCRYKGENMKEFDWSKHAEANFGTVRSEVRGRI